jgi:hypothetical protein
MHSLLRLLAIVLTVTLPHLGVADDINPEFDCTYGDIPSDGNLEFAWVAADVTLLKTKILSEGPREIRQSGTVISLYNPKHYGRCPRVQEECEPGKRVADGSGVAIWKRHGQFACVTPDLPHAGESGWIHEDHLLPIEKTEPSQPDWVGTFTNGGFSEVTVSKEPGGGLLASGAVIAGAGEGPGFSYYDVSQIDLSPFEPQGRSGTLPPVRTLEAISQKDGVRWRNKVSAPLTCRLMLRLSGPFLVIKDAPGCTGEQASGFEGIWVREQGEPKEAHHDHAKTIQLGR